MSLFKSKNKNTEVMETQNRSILQARDRIEFKKIDKRSEEVMFSMCDSIIDGRPVLANFDLLDADDCNLIITFLSGCVYALAGDVVQISERLFLFASGESFEDGSLEAYIEDNRG